ncbi:MAG: hypothetical protein ACK6DC_10840, partial [Planctomycetota bacterium]
TVRAVTAKNRPSSAPNDLNGLELGLDDVHLSLIRSFTSYRRNACNSSPTKTQCMSLFSVNHLDATRDQPLQNASFRGGGASPGSPMPVSRRRKNSV